MERIKKAIEKAKGGSAAKRSKAAASPIFATGDLANIAYQKTPVVSLDRKHLEQHRIVALDKNNVNSVSFDVLRTQVVKKMEENGWKTLAIVSPIPECGKTVVAINLAISIAQHAERTAILLDFDLRKPRIATYLGIDPAVSMNEVLLEGLPVEAAFVNPGVAKLVVVPTRAAIRNSSEILASSKIETMIREIRERYDQRIVIVDLPPLLSVDDAMAVLPNIDCVLLVVGNGMVGKSELDESLHLLKDVNLLGVILNKSELQKNRYYYE